MATQISLKQLGTHDITPYLGGQVFLKYSSVTTWGTDIQVAATDVLLKSGDALTALQKTVTKMVHILTDDGTSLKGIALVKSYDKTTDKFTINAFEYGTGSGTGGNNTIVAEQFEYEQGYTYSIDAPGTNYSLNDIIPTDVAGVNVKVTSTDTDGAITAVEFTRETTTVISGTDAIITATVNPDVFVIPSKHWTSEINLFSLTNDDGAIVEFFKANDVLTKYNAGANGRIYQFVFDNVNGTITQTFTTAGGGNIKYVETLPMNVLTMEKNTFYINNLGYSFTPDGIQLVYHNHCVSFVTALPTVGASDVLYVCLSDSTLSAYDGAKWVTLGGGASNIEFNTKSNFPTVGDVKALYVEIDENMIYRYDSGKASYVALSSSNNLKTYSTLISGDDANNSFAINHALDTTKLFVSVYDSATGESVPFEQIILDTNNIKISWGNVIPTGTNYQVDILGW